jgi:pimeloyl-ACP methyl ester carboxylesterase
MVETLILVPGLNCTRRLFESQIEALSRSRTVLVADTTQDDSLAGMARRLLLNAPDRFALAGLSMGGYVALEVLRQAPGRVAALALLDTSARPETEAARADREHLIAMAESGRFEEVHAVLWPRLVAGSRSDDRILEAAVLAMMREIGSEAFVRQERAIMARPDSRPDLPAIEIPTLVLVGEEDRLTPPELAREMAEMIEWASLVVVPESRAARSGPRGHDRMARSGGRALNPGRSCLDLVSG